jgi:hypothetical protein
MAKSSIFDAKTVINSLLGIIGIFAAITIFSVFSRPVISEAQDSNIIQWEYLTISYSQNRIVDSMGNFDADINRYELILTDDEYYANLFWTVLTEGCNVSDVNSILFDSEAQNCIGGNFLGREAVLDTLGMDRWELVDVDNTSSEYAYQLDLTFKRPLLGG